MNSPKPYEETHTFGASISTHDEAEIFANALEIVDLQNRAKYLDTVAGIDTAARERLERLLQYSLTNDGFLESTVSTPPWSESSRIESVGDWLGPYRLIQEIGEGGMGVVFLAQQSSPLQRRVAIKVVKPGMDSQQVLARFEAERQVLAMMEHPNIARAIDVGVSEHGRTYFVMELVEGLPITRFCDEKQLDIRQRLELFLPVCLAIQHAHQKGIIHRDLKPSNVMVATYDGSPVPKVIDFGVAKALNPLVSQNSLFTQLGQIVGTIEYMSPEQARSNPLDIDTRSDIYSLGILLYELLTGTTPLQSSEIKTLGWDEMVKKIREEEAPTPSQRLKSLNTIDAVAISRRCEGKKLISLLAGELDWILIKALDKERERRYQNAAELMEDIQRYLSGEEVSACPPSTYYRATKYLRRNRFTLFAGGLVTASLALGFAGTAWQAWHANRASAQAEIQRDIAKREAERAKEASTIAQKEAEKSLKESEITRAVAGFVNEDLIAFADPNLEPDRDIRLRELIDRAANKMESLKTAPLVEAAVRYTLAKSYLGLGEYNAASIHATKSWALRNEHLSPSDKETLESLLLCGEADLKLSHFHQAIDKFDQARQSFRNSTDGLNVLRLDCDFGYGVALAKLGRLNDALETLRDVVEGRREYLGKDHLSTLDAEEEVAEILLQKGEYFEARKSFDGLAETLSSSIGASHPLTFKTVAGSANVDFELGDFASARTKRESLLTRQIKVLGEFHPETLLATSNLTLVTKLFSANHADVLEKNLELLQIAREKLGINHAVSTNIAYNVSELLSEQGKSKEAIRYLEELRRAFLEGNQSQSPNLLKINYHIASCLAFDGAYRESLELYRKTLSEQQSLLSKKHLDALKTEYGLAILLMSVGDFSSAKNHLENIITHANHSDLRTHPILLIAESKLGTLENVLGKRSSLDRQRAVCLEAKERYGDDTRIVLEMEIALAESLIRFGQTADAKSILTGGLSKLNQSRSENRMPRAQLLDALVETLLANSEFAEAIRIANELLAERKEFLGEQHPLTLRSKNQLGVALVRSGKPSEGIVWIREAWEQSQALLGKQLPTTLIYQQNLASTLGVLAIADSSKRRETLQRFEELTSIQSAWGVDHPDWLFSQLGYVGALAQQNRFLQAEKICEPLLLRFIAVYGETHPQTLRCRENYAIILAALGKHQASVDQCRAYLQSVHPYGPAQSKIVHAAIEQYICMGKTLGGHDLVQSALEWASSPNYNREWLFHDLPFITDAIQNRDGVDAASQFLAESCDVFESQLGPKNPKTQFMMAMRLVLSFRNKDTATFNQILSQLRSTAERESHGEDADSSDLTASELVAAIAQKWQPQPSLYSVALFAMAAEMSGSASDVALETDTLDYRALAIDALRVCSENGKLRSVRAKIWLKHSSDLNALRDKEDFQELETNIEAANLIEKFTRQSWEFATAGEPQKAKETLQQFSKEYPDLANLGTVQYLMSRTYAVCYESAKRNQADSSASEFMDACRASLETCSRLGFFNSPDHRKQLATDQNFESVRQELELVKTLSDP
jgi:eukaryotic-like serine/threonine-protein kinase